MLLPDSGHGAHFQYVERFVRRVIDFLDVQPHDTATPARPPSKVSTSSPEPPGDLPGGRRVICLAAPVLRTRPGSG
jgi:hypothetical protein